MMIRNMWKLIVPLVVAVLAGQVQAQHEGDVWVGRSAPGLDDNGYLAVSPSGFVPAENYAYLEPVSGVSERLGG